MLQAAPPLPVFEGSGPPFVFKDNSGPALPEVCQRILETNSMVALDAYGTDEQTTAAIEMLRGIFGERARVFFAPTGTFANTLGCSLIRPEEGILLTPGSHLLTMESGGPKVLAAPDFVPLPAKEGKFDIDALEAFDPGPSRRLRMVHVTQPTEYGTLYTIDELRRIGAYCAANHLLMGMDGARLPHAAQKLNVGLRELSVDVGADFLTLGVAKCGGLHGNALILTDPQRTKEKGCIIPDDKGIFNLIKLRGGTQSRIWEIAVQFSALFENELWRQPVSRAISLAQSFTEGLRAEGIVPEYPVDTNAVFIRMGEDAQERIGSLKWQFYRWHEDPCLARFMFAFYTPEGVMRALLKDIIQLKRDGIEFTGQ